MEIDVDLTDSKGNTCDTVARVKIRSTFDRNYKVEKKFNAITSTPRYVDII